MKTVQIRLSLVENVNRFVNIVGRYPFDMDLRAGRHVVDAKSILGILFPGPEQTDYPGDLQRGLR